MAFKLKRNRKSNNKSKLLKRLKQLEAKATLTEKEKVELENILLSLDKKKTNKIESKKLNNDKINEAAVSVYQGGTSDLNLDHLQSAAGVYRRGRIDNAKK